MRKNTRNMYYPPDYVDQEMSQGLSPGVIKPLKFRDWLTWEHDVLITLLELQKKCKMITKITSTQNMVNLVDTGKLSRVLQVCLMKLIEANNTYINTYVLSPTTLDDLFYLW